jgi:hypothetical protein
MSPPATAESAAAKAPAGTPFHLDSDEFPIGLFSVDSPAAMDRAAGLGIGYVHTYANSAAATPTAIAKSRAYLDAAHKRGLKVLFHLNGRRYVGREHGLEKFRVVVEAVKDHPALGFWYLYDEPDGKHTAAELAPFYRALKELTPDIPVAVASAWTKHWYAYQDVLDILMIDIYPVQHRPFPRSKLNNTTAFTWSALGWNKPVMPINQCMNWRALAGTGKTYRGSPTAELRYPTAAELRYFCYSGLVQGVRGMFWWSYTRSVQVDPRWMEEAFGPVVREFRDFTRLVAPAHKPDSFCRDRKARILPGVWRRPAGTFLVLVNATPEEQSGDISLAGMSGSGRLTPWRTSRKIEAALTAGQLRTGPLRPWEVLIWKLENKATETSGGRRDGEPTRP